MQRCFGELFPHRILIQVIARSVVPDLTVNWKKHSESLVLSSYLRMTFRSAQENFIKVASIIMENRCMKR
jgi:hypothetical protein